MPAAKWPPSPKPHKPGIWRVYWRGRDFYVVGRDPEDPEFRRNYARLLAELSAGVRRPAGGTTLHNVCREFLERYADRRYRRDDGSPTSEIDEFRRSLAPALDLYGETPAAEFAPDRLRAVRRVWVDSGCCRNTCNRRARRIVFALEWAAGEGMLDASVPSALNMVKPLGVGDAPDYEDVGPPPDGAVEATLPFLPMLPRLLVEFQIATGCRPGEAQALTVGEVLSAPERDGVRLVKLDWHKTKKRGGERVVLIGPRAADAIAALLENRRPGEYVFSPRWQAERIRLERRARRKTPARPVPAARAKREPARTPGERYSETAYAHAVRVAALKAGAPHWHPNCLRHSAATYLEETYGYEVARVVLGHASIDTTRIYTKGSMANAIKAILESG